MLVARTICRRAERHSLAILPSEKGETEPENIDSVERGIKYLNRLSDYLFTLGRYYCHKCGGKGDILVAIIIFLLYLQPINISQKHLLI